MRLRVLLLLSALPLSAGDESAFGLVLGPDLALGQLRNNDPLGTHRTLGFHGGIQFRGSLDGLNDLRAQLEFIHFGGSRSEVTGQENRYEVRQLGMDWTHGFSPWEHRAYLIVGGSMNNFNAAYTGPRSPSPTRFERGALGLRVGGGFAFSRHFQIEGHFNQVLTKRTTPGGIGFRPAQWFQTSAVIQF